MFISPLFDLAMATPYGQVLSSLQMQLSLVLRSSLVGSFGYIYDSFMNLPRCVLLVVKHSLLYVQ